MVRSSIKDEGGKMVKKCESGYLQNEEGRKAKENLEMWHIIIDEGKEPPRRRLGG